jgi:hypothetical protein
LFVTIENQKVSVSRRNILKAGTAAAALAASGSLLNAAEEATTTAPTSRPAVGPLPTRPLGKSGIPVSILNLGCGGAKTQRQLDHAYEIGIRYFDTAESYANGKSEQEIARWFERTGKRKEIFLVTKAGVKEGPEAIPAAVDKRLETLKIDYIDLFFIHALTAKGSDGAALGWPKSDAWKKAAEKLKASGKVKLTGFSCHNADQAECLSAAAEGGFVDAIMLSYNTVLGDKADKLNRAMDACHKAGIGLIAMKTMRGIGEQLKAKHADKTSLAAAVIHAVLSDERIASICSDMGNFPQMDQNAAAARSFKPMTSAQVEQLRQTILAGGMAYCPGCDGCRGMAASHAHEISRYLSYYEQDGRRAEAQHLYRALPAEARNLSATDLAAASQACSCGVDYASIVQRAAEKLA